MSAFVINLHVPKMMLQSAPMGVTTYPVTGQVVTGRPPHFKSVQLKIIHRYRLLCRPQLWRNSEASQ